MDEIDLKVGTLHDSVTLTVTKKAGGYHRGKSHETFLLTANQAVKLGRELSHAAQGATNAEDI